MTVLKKSLRKLEKRKCFQYYSPQKFVKRTDNQKVSIKTLFSNVNFTPHCKESFTPNERETEAIIILFHVYHPRRNVMFGNGCSSFLSKFALVSLVSSQLKARLH